MCGYIRTKALFVKRIQNMEGQRPVLLETRTRSRTKRGGHRENERAEHVYRPNKTPDHVDDPGQIWRARTLLPYRLVHRNIRARAPGFRDGASVTALENK